MFAGTGPEMLCHRHSRFRGTTKGAASSRKPPTSKQGAAAIDSRVAVQWKGAMDDGTVGAPRYRAGGDTVSTVARFI